MNNERPFFSIIVPTYNRKELILKTVNSVLNQTFTSFELLIIDDGGNDSTEEMLNELNSQKIRYFKKINEERGAARNFGWNKALGIYVNFLDSDDIVYPEYLQHAYNEIGRLNKPACFAQAYEIIRYKKGKEIRIRKSRSEEIINEALIEGNFLSCFGVFLKRELIESVSFEMDRRFSGTEDWLLWLQLCALYPFYYSGRVTGALIEHEGRSVNAFPEESLRFRTDYLREKLEENKLFIEKFGRKSIMKIFAHMLSYTSLHLASSGKRNRALYFLILAISIRPNELLRKRTLSILKHLIF